jgi:hypothetical protein
MKKCKQGYYYCYTDKKCKRIPMGYRVASSGYLRKENGKDSEENSDNEESVNGNGGNGNGGDGGGVSEGTLHKWFKGSKSKDGKPGWVNVKTGGTCASDEPGEGTPKCVSSEKRARMTKAERNSASRRKKAADPSQQQKFGAAKPTYVSTDKPKKKMNESQEKDHEYSMIRSQISTIMSASKRLKGKMGKGEGNVKAWVQSKITKAADYLDTAADYVDSEEVKVKEELEIIEGKDKKGKGSGTKDACYTKVKSRYSVWPSAYASGALVKCRKVGASNWGNKTESVEYSDWRDDFKATEYEFVDIIKPEPIKGGQEQIDEGQKCWKDYVKKGTKKMFGKTYNNCVKKEGYDVGDVDQKVGAVTPIPKDEIEAAKQRLLAKTKAKREKIKEEKEESKIGGGNLKKLTAKAVKRIDADVDGDVDTDDMKSSEMGEFIPSPDGKKRIKTKVRFEGASDWRNELEEGAAWTKKSGKNKKGGLNEKGRKSYERENPGSDLKAPSKKKGNKRRASFCARMKGMKKKLTSAKTARDPDSRINKSLRAWNC